MSISAKMRQHSATVLLFCCSTVTAQDTVPITTIAVNESVHMLMGRGGNVGVSIGESGTFVVDDQYATQSEVLRDAISKLSTTQASFVLNTHWHSDHTGGNEAMNKGGAMIVAHDNVRERLSTDQVIEFFNAERPAAPAAALPVITFSETLTFHYNDDDIHVFHVPNAHTDSDAVIQFRRANVIHTGDVFFHGRYPFIDVGTGGSISGMIAAIEKILTLCDDNTKVIPGHGELTDRKGLSEYSKMLSAVRKSIAELIVAGNSEEQIIGAKPTAKFDAVWGTGFIKPDVFVKLVLSSIRQEMLN